MASRLTAGHWPIREPEATIKVATKAASLLRIASPGSKPAMGWDRIEIIALHTAIPDTRGTWMLISAILASMAMQAPIASSPDPRVYSGREGRIEVAPPKLAETVVVDGVLDEPAWTRAAILTGFSQFTPVDGQAAADSTEVLVWYSSRALHLGVRAWDRTGTVRNTLAQRDRISGDDNIQFYISTFNDGRQAIYLAVNPLGVQADGALNESGRSGSCNGFNCATATREGPDLSQDFVWHSRGRMTEWGYEVEIEVPLKSIRFQSADVQTWGINVLRVVHRTGQEQTWTQARIGQSSFLAQSGSLTGLEGLRTGRALDIVPTMTSRVTGARSPTGSGWDYEGGSPEFGGHLRWGVTPNLTLNATANPDFSQVESDAGQFSFDPRQALYFAERRPFFLDGNEQFQAPNNLIYTRRIVQPVAAVKLTGRISGTQIGVLGALDDDAVSRSGDHPVYGIIRATRDLAGGSQIGFTHTEQHDGADRNRVSGIDGRLVFDQIHSITFSGAVSSDLLGGTTTNSELWAVGYRLNGRSFRARYSVSGIDDEFRTRSGFISRPGVGRANMAHSYTWLRPERTLESFTGEVVLDGTWHYDSLVGGGGIQDRKLHFNFNSQWRGGWGAGLSVLVEDFGYDPAIYQNYALLNPDGSLSPFVGVPRIPNLDYVLTARTPNLPFGALSVFALWGRDENFPEWASGDILWLTLELALRPTDKLRANLSYNRTQVNRRNDGSQVVLQQVPRARLEYQLSRSLQVRAIGEYAMDEQDALRDNSRTELPIVYLDGQGGFRRAEAYRNGRLRGDLLLSYFPHPGTVVYLGYGTTHSDPDLDGRARLGRSADGFFMKLSYLFRTGG
jgi:hypothetical protein